MSISSHDIPKTTKRTKNVAEDSDEEFLPSEEEVLSKKVRTITKRIPPSRTSREAIPLSHSPKGVSCSTQGALNGKEPTIEKASRHSAKSVATKPPP